MVAAVVGHRERRREQARREILDAAWRLAERDGVANLSLRGLATEVGMRAPSLYTYFENKAAIYDAMFADGYRAFRELGESLALDPEDLVGSLTEVIVEFLAFCQDSLARYHVMFTRVVGDWEPSPEAYATSLASYDTMVGQFAAAGIEGQEALDLWTALTSGLAAQQIANDPGGDRWIRRSRDVAEMFVSHLGRRR